MEIIQVLKSIETSSHFKKALQVFFEGVPDLGIRPTVDIPVYKFEITDLEIEFQQTKIFCYITLCRPGFFVGSAGSNLDKLEEFLSITYSKPVKFVITESKLWK